MATLTISKSAKDDFSLESIKGYGEATGTAIAGFVVAHVAMKTLKQSDSLLANAALLPAGIAGAIYLKHPLAKMACIGAAIYGGVRATNIMVAEVVSDAPAAVDPKTGQPVKGVLGSIGDHIPEALKAKIRSFLPTLGDANELLGIDDEIGDIDLDDNIGNTEDVDYEDVTNVKGIGSSQML